ncbi:MAG: xanthine dehydrogenase family protein subunit M [Acidobacteriaceae bacterium]|nr:xanthine dehydrogenase family protein subunit M [Acidobacteriaceae bacterium]
MQSFEYASPKTVKEALGLLGTKWGEVDILAGGTDQVSLMKEYLHTPKRVVNIKGIKELHGIHHSAQGLRIGAVVTFDELASDKAVHSEYPALVSAVLGVASPQIRNMGTVGGDLCQRPRCWYFRNGYGLLAMKEGKSLVPNGQNEYHAIFGGGPAYFVSPSSLGPALVALGAEVRLVSASGSRSVPVSKFFVNPQNDQSREIALMPNEILTEIIIPPLKGAKNATYEVRQKEALDWPLATASVMVQMNGSKVEKSAVVLGHVAPVPWVASSASQALNGQSLSDDVIAKAAEAAVADAKPLSQNEYKVQLTRVAVKRALQEAAGKNAG